MLSKEIKKKKMGTVWVSGVCDPYQPLEARYKLTRQCLEILVKNDWPVVIQTRSPLVLRDLDIFRKKKNIKVGLTITTANDETRKIFEPYGPPIEERLKAIATLHQNGIRTYVMIAPILPEAGNLIPMLAGKIDRMNYYHADKIYKKYGWKEKNTYEYFETIGNKIENDCRKLGIECRSAYLRRRKRQRPNNDVYFFR
ncbi:MAG: radical SAM protein [Smithella sp.]